MPAGGTKDARAENGAPLVDAQSNTMDRAPFEPQSFQDRLMPCAEAIDTDSASIAPAITRVFFIAASKMLLLLRRGEDLLG